MAARTQPCWCCCQQPSEVTAPPAAEPSRPAYLPCAPETLIKVTHDKERELHFAKCPFHLNPGSVHNEPVKQIRAGRPGSVQARGVPWELLAHNLEWLQVAINYQQLTNATTQRVRSVVLFWPRLTSQQPTSCTVAGSEPSGLAEGHQRRPPTQNPPKSRPGSLS